jgi:hypothetical protein
MKTEEDIRKYMYDRWPDKGSKKQQMVNLLCRRGFYECWHFVNGTYDRKELERKEIAHEIQKQIMEDFEDKPKRFGIGAGNLIGGGDHLDGLLAMKIAEMKEMNQNIEIITIDQAKEMGLMESREFKLRPNALEMIQPIELKENHYGFTGKSPRNKRREEERKAKKNKRK